MKTRLFQTAITLTLVLLHAGSLAALPAAEICAAPASAAGCSCGMDCCTAGGSASSMNHSLKESPCCTARDADDSHEAAVPVAKTSVPPAPRPVVEIMPTACTTPAASGESTANLPATRIPCVTTASIPLLNSALLI